MNRTPALTIEESPDDTILSLDRSIILIMLAALASAAPFLSNLYYFKRLFWFGDELHLISELDHEGFMPWVMGVFAENFVPLFKLLWGGGMLLFHGNYFAMVSLMWATHIFNVIVFGLLLKRLSIKGTALFFSCILFGLPWTNIGTLVWVVQWSQVLSMTFLFLSAHVLLSMQEKGRCSLKDGVLFFLACLAGTLCFSKGVIVCASLIVWCFFMLQFTWKRPWYGMRPVVLSALPMIMVALLIISYSSGNHKSLLGSGWEEYKKAIEFAACYFFLNPLFHLFRLFVPFYDSTPYLLALSPIKLFVYSFGLYKMYKDKHYPLLQFLLFLIVFDLANTAVLGIGRYHEGNYSAVVKRYQYTSLISFAPFAGILLKSVIDSLNNRIDRLGFTFTSFATNFLASLFLLYVLAAPWWVEIKETSRWSGKQGRRLIFHNKLRPDRPREHGQWIGIPPILSLEEVRRVVKKYNLH